MSTFTPIEDRILVEPNSAEEITPGGIIIPTEAKERPLKGVVVASGPGKKDEPMQVKVGDIIVYGEYSGVEIEVDGKKYLIMKESDIHGIVD